MTCSLQICDFGLARVEELDPTRHMTQEVVTQYYRAPEILMGATNYGMGVDMWSVGCIFAELLSRKILFQAQSPLQQVSCWPNIMKRTHDTHVITTLAITFSSQLDLIVELLGTPTAEDMKYAVASAKRHVLRHARRMSSQSSAQRSRLSIFHAMQQTDRLTVDLLGRMLKFDPVRLQSVAVSH